MTAEQTQLWFLAIQLAQIGLTVATLLWAAVTRRSKANASEIDGLRNRVTLLEERVKALPDQVSVGRIYEEIRKITNGQARLEATVSAQGESVTRIANNVGDLLRHELASLVAANAKSGGNHV